MNRCPDCQELLVERFGLLRCWRCSKWVAIEELQWYEQGQDEASEDALPLGSKAFSGSEILHPFQTLALNTC